MNLLEYYHNQHPHNENFIPRKSHIPKDGDINLFGVRSSGKTSLVLDFLEQKDKKDSLYIDLQDPNLIFNALTTLALQHYIDKENITLLILDHYEEGLLASFPNVKRLIVLSRIALKHTSLASMELFPLDYEEFLAFESTSAQNRGFNHFLRSGTLPLLARSQKTSTQTMKIFFKSSFTQMEQKLLLILAQHHTKHLTTHQIYIFAKEKFKVSKDWIYKTIKIFSNEKVILFVENSYQTSGKKILLFDFAFAKYLTIGQPFIV